VCRQSADRRIPFSRTEKCGTLPGSRYGKERMRQKLFVVASGVFVNTSAPNEFAGLVNCGIQLGGDRLVERSSA
jgi:hypothetical protein